MTWSLMGMGRGYRLAHWLTMRLTRHRPLCHAAVWPYAAGVVRGSGHLYCCQAHTDTHQQCLDTACQNFARRHATHPTGTTGCCPLQERTNPAHASHPRGATIPVATIEAWGTSHDGGRAAVSKGAAVDRQRPRRAGHHRHGLGCSDMHTSSVRLLSGALLTSPTESVVAMCGGGARAVCSSSEGATHDGASAPVERPGQRSVFRSVLTPALHAASACRALHEGRVTMSVEYRVLQADAEQCLFARVRAHQGNRSWETLPAALGERCQ